MNARHKTAEEFMKAHYGKLDTALAEAYLGDHYDSFDKKIEPGDRSLCGHEDTGGSRARLCGACPPYASMRRGHGQGDGLGHGSEAQLHRPRRPSVRRGLPRRAISCRASGVRLGAADPARHEGRPMDDVLCG